MPHGKVYEEVLRKEDVTGTDQLFVNCVFKKGVDLSCDVFDGVVKFDNCVCHGEFNISGVTIRNGKKNEFCDQPLLILDQTKVMGGVDMRGIHVHGAVHAIGLEVEGGIQGSTLKGNKCTGRNDDFPQDQYGDPDQRKVRTIMALGDFTDLRCKGTVNFAGCYVGRDFRFVNAKIGSTFRLAQWLRDQAQNNLPHAKIGGMLDMHGANVDGDIYLQGLQVDGEAIFSNMVVLQTMILRPWFSDERGDAEVKREVEEATNSCGQPTIFRQRIRATRITIHGLLDLSGACIMGDVNLDYSTIGALWGKVCRKVKQENDNTGHQKPAWRKTVPAISEVARYTVELVRILASLDTQDDVKELDWKRIQAISGVTDEAQFTAEGSPSLAGFLDLFAKWSIESKQRGGSEETKKYHNPLLKFYDHQSIPEPWKPKIGDKKAFIDTFSIEDFTEVLETADKFCCTYIQGEVSLRTTTVRGDLEFMGAVLAKGLDLSGCTIDGSLICRAASSDEKRKDIASARDADAINTLLPCVVGCLEKSRDVEVSIAGENLRVGRYVSFSGAIITNGINFLAAEVEGLFSLDSIGACRTMVGTAKGPDERLYSLRLSGATVGGNVTFVGSYLESGLSLENSKVVGDVIGFSYWFDHKKEHIPYLLEGGTDERRTFVGQGVWAKGEIAALQFNGLEVGGDLDLRGCFCVGGILAQSATLNGSLMLGGIERPPSGEGNSRRDKETYFTSFVGRGRDAEGGEYSLFLNTSTVRGDVDLRGSILVSGMRVSNATINGHLILLPYLHDENDATKVHERALLGTSSGAGLSRSTPQNNYRIQVSVNGTGMNLHGYFYGRGCYFLSGVFVSMAEIRGVVDFSPFPYQTQTGSNPEQSTNEHSINTLIRLGLGPDGAVTGLRMVGTEVNSILLEGVDWRAQSDSAGNTKPPTDKTEHLTDKTEHPIATFRGAVLKVLVQLDEKPNIPKALKIKQGFSWYDFTSAKCGRVIFSSESKSNSSGSESTSKSFWSSLGFASSELLFLLGVGCLVFLPMILEIFGWNGQILVAVMVVFGVLVGLSKWLSNRAFKCYRDKSDPLLGKTFDFRDVKVESLYAGTKENDEKEKVERDIGWLRCSGTGQTLYGSSGAFLAASIPLVVAFAFGIQYSVGVAIVSLLLYYVMFHIRLFSGRISFAGFVVGLLGAITFLLVYLAGHIGEIVAAPLVALFLFIGYTCSRSYTGHAYGVVLARCFHDEAIFLAVEHQYRAEGKHYEADCVSLQWQRLQFLRTRLLNLRWLPDLSLHLLTGHGVRMLPMVSAMVYIALWGTLLFKQEGAVVKNPDYQVITGNGNSQLDTSDAFLLTMGYFWPISHVQSRSEWVASSKEIQLHGMPSFPKNEQVNNHSKLTYANVASILSLLGWIWLPLLIQNLLKFIPRVKERRS